MGNSFNKAEVYVENHLTYDIDVLGWNGHDTTKWQTSSSSSLSPNSESRLGCECAGCNYCDLTICVERYGLGCESDHGIAEASWTKYEKNNESNGKHLLLFPKEDDATDVLFVERNYGSTVATFTVTNQLSGLSAKTVHKANPTDIQYWPSKSTNTYASGQTKSGLLCKVLDDKSCTFTISVDGFDDITMTADDGSCYAIQEYNIEFADGSIEKKITAGEVSCGRRLRGEVDLN